MMKYIEKGADVLLSGRQAVGIFLFVLTTLLGAGQAWGYTVMDNDRILLMNNDKKTFAAVTCQGYYDTNTTEKTYWVHSKEAANMSYSAALKGVTHTMYRRDGTRLWHLTESRAGSSTYVGNASRNYIPWSATAVSILSDAGTKIAADTAGAKKVGSITFRNVLGACVYSPYYEEGIGTIYFDSVNLFTGFTTAELGLFIATNVTKLAAESGVSFESVTDNYDDLDWRSCPFDVFAVESGRTITPFLDGVTNLVLDVTDGGSNKFYRARSRLDFRAPIRFCIRRLNASDGNKDTTGLVILDNIIASYPPMTATLNRYGRDLDDSLQGKEVLGCLEDFSTPFIGYGSSGVKPWAWFGFVTNGATAKALKITNPRLCYRWRYLNQLIGDWKTLPFDQSSISSASVSTTNLIGTAGIDLTDGTGDIEYFYTAEIDAPYYDVRDYACSAGYGAGWTEKISAITNRAVYTVEDALPSCGTDYFVRIREGASDYEWVRWEAKLEKPGVTNDVSARMELVGDHSWRYHYYVNTNDIGGKLKFHFTAKKVVTNDVPFSFVSTTNIWCSSDSDISDIPFTATLGGASGDAVVTLDGTGTHLLFELNEADKDRTSFSVSHATYQDVNRWTDAMVGYRGNAVATNEDGSVMSNIGVSDAKTRYEPVFEDWKTCPFTYSGWLEPFTTDDRVAYPLDTLFSTHPTPNGWTAVSARFVPGARGDAENLAFQLSGGGDGALTMENFNKSTVPPGLDMVSFTARVAQQHVFSNFAYFEDGTGCRNYGFSARLAMSRRYDSKLGTNPDDISPVYPSVSLVGYYRPMKGCYEFRVTRTGQNDLTCALYKWSSGDSSTTATLLTSNILHTGSSSTPGKTASGSNQPQVPSFNNLLVPQSTAETQYCTGSYGYISLYTDASGHVHVECALSNKRVNRNTQIASESTSSLYRVLTWEDANPGALVKGTYGIGSVDCQAAFGSLRVHAFKSATDYSQGLDLSGTSESANLADNAWACYSSRWAQLTGDEIIGTGSETAGLKALIPSNQTMKVYLADANLSGSDANWVYSGYEVAVPSFSTNRFTVSPRLPGLWKVRLQTGGAANDEVKTDVVIDDVIVTPWQGISVGDAFGSNRADPYSVGDWAYTKAWIGSSADITREDKPYGGYSLQAAGTNGYVFIFNEPGDMIHFKPKMEMVIDRILVVGGGGAGGWTLGGGGGGGGVLEYDFGTNAVVIAEGEDISITVGKGGDNYYVARNDGSYWKSGQNGGDTSISSYTLNTRVNRNANTAIKVKGGGGGAGWNQRNASSGATGGGSAQGNNSAYYSSRAAGTAGQGNSGGRAYGDRAGGGGGASLNEDGQGQDGNATDDKAGDGGNGRPSDITGSVVYYGGGGGGGGGDGNKTPNSAGGGEGGLGGGGKGPPARATVADRLYMDGTDGLGGGGAGGSHSGAAGTNAGGKGGCGAVIIRCRSASKALTLQPSRVSRDTSGTTDAETGKYLIEPVGLRSPYIDNGLSMFSVSYANADTNCVLLVQIATNMVNDAPVYSCTYSSATNLHWTTIRTFDFANDPELATETARRGGTLTTFLSLRRHMIYDEYQTVRGLMRVIIDPALVERVVSNTEEVIETQDSSHRLNTNYGCITLTRAYCYNEPPLDTRSWWGWNLHTEGWDGAGTAGDYAYLTDWPDGLSLSLNYSAKKADNEAADAKGIGLGEPEKEGEYAANNPFVQSPEMTNGVGSVSFRARLFDTNATSAVITLYASSEPSTDQATIPEAWSMVTNFVVTSPTYRTFSWKTTEDKNSLRAVRLEMAGARHGRRPSTSGGQQTWETTTPAVEPIQRVFIDEISVGEPIAPRLALRHCRPFRTNLRAEDICVITNISSQDQQPILGESWGVQVHVEPQQMSDELVEESVEVHLSVLRGKETWGYDFWPSNATARLVVNDVRLPRVSPTDLVFRSHFSVPGSIVPPEDVPNTYYQYKVWARYQDKSQVGTDNWHVHTLDAADWSTPEWYWGGTDYNEKYVDRFAAFTILDSISPRRAWINEVNFQDARDPDHRGTQQFIEFAVPQGADLTGWRVQAVSFQQHVAEIARFGIGDAGITEKQGTQDGKDFLKDAHYTFVALRGPEAKKAGTVSEADGAWSDLSTKMRDDYGYETTIADFLGAAGGVFRYNYPYGLRLIRPSGIIEHEIVVQGTNTWIGWSDEWKRSGTNLVAKMRASDGRRSTWLYAGEDSPAGSVGVVKSHGEYGEYPNDPALNCWQTGLSPTPAAINQFQQFPMDYFLAPNGTNVWIYAYALGDHVSQVMGGLTNKSAVIIVEKGTSTGITYRVDNWYQTAGCAINGAPHPAGDGHSGTYTLDLGTVQDTMTVEMKDAAQQGVKDLGVDTGSPYYDAIMHWLTTRWPDASADDITRAQYMDMAGTTNGVLSLTEMYWLNIPPVAEPGQPATKGENWILKGGMGRTGTPGAGLPGSDSVTVVTRTDAEGGTHRNVQVTVTLMVSNTVDAALTRTVDTLQGVEPGSSSAAFTGPGRWRGPTFKITGALQANNMNNVFRPLREFMLCERSFGAKGDPDEFTTKIEIADPQTWKSSPGWHYGWDEFPGAAIWYGFRLNDESIGYMSVEMLDDTTRVTP